MCFSMQASFGAGAVLGAIGVACIKKVYNSEQLLFASIPLVFSAQQFAEGFIWLSLSNAEYASWQQPMTIFFLVVAHIIWPIFIPVSVYLLEKEIKRKKILLFLSVTGLLLSAYFGWYLLSNQVSANANGHHIFYDRNFPFALRIAINSGYGLTAVLPLFISSIKRVWMLGLMFLIAFAVAKIFYTIHVISVWCFFAALLSILVYAILYRPADMRYEV